MKQETTTRTRSVVKYYFDAAGPVTMEGGRMDPTHETKEGEAFFIMQCINLPVNS
jgi:hypothetical protein